MQWEKNEKNAEGVGMSGVRITSPNLLEESREDHYQERIEAGMQSQHQTLPDIAPREHSHDPG